MKNERKAGQTFVTSRMDYCYTAIVAGCPLSKSITDKLHSDTHKYDCSLSHVLHTDS